MASHALHVLAVVIGQQIYNQLDFSLYTFGPKENCTVPFTKNAIII